MTGEPVASKLRDRVSDRLVVELVELRLRDLARTERSHAFDSAAGLGMLPIGSVGIGIGETLPGRASLR